MTAGILVMLLLVGLVMPASAESVIWDYTAYEFTDTSGYREKPSGSTQGTYKYEQLYMVDISLYQTLNYIVVTIPSTSVGYSDSGNLLDSGRHEFTYALKDQHDKPLIVYIERFAASTKITMFFEDWDIETLSGIQRVDINGMYFMSATGGGRATSQPQFYENPIMVTYHKDGYYYIPQMPVRVDWTSGIEWQNHINLIELDPNPLGGYEFSLTRNIDGKYSQSTCKIYNEEEIIFTDSSTTDIMDRWYSIGSITQINIESPTGRIYKFPVTGGADPVDQSTTVTVYVRNSQTGALLADAHIQIEDTTTDPWTEVVNQTLSSGQGTISLAKDPGIHLTQYRIGATVPGYQQVVPALFFRVTGPTNVVVEMEPVVGGPINEDNAYLEFYVRDLNANGIPNANVQVDGQMRWTNAQGYTQIEVAKNASYPYSVSKSGYVTIEGTATVADGPRYVVNVVLGPGTVPTYTPTSGPGETPGGPGATPTPDHRTNEQKGQAVIDMIADNAEGIGALALICLLMGLLKLLAKW
jgi:hypothetical protein